MNCANQYLETADDNYQCNLQVSDQDCLKLYNVQADESQDRNKLMNTQCSTSRPALPNAVLNVNRERYCCPNSRTSGNDQTGTYTGSLLGGSCQ